MICPRICARLLLRFQKIKNKMTEMKEDRRQKRQSKRKIKCKKYQQTNLPTNQHTNSVDLNSSNHLFNISSAQQEAKRKLKIKSPKIQNPESSFQNPAPAPSEWGRRFRFFLFRKPKRFRDLWLAGRRGIGGSRRNL